MEPMPPEAFLADYPEPMHEIREWLRGVVPGAIPEAVDEASLG